VAKIGTVRVDDYCRVESLPTVHHLVSTVSCELAAGPEALLAATFPGGSITGAPKIRAMQIIAELEPVPRGLYTGALGWIAGDRLELSLVIRTAVIAGGELRLHVGGGIVADSTAARELEECEEKAAAWRSALT
jgi:anthranilate/para-aminobenzoate synthase component I